MNEQTLSLRRFFRECYESSQKKGWHDKFLPIVNAINYFRSHDENGPEEQKLADELEAELKRSQLRLLIEKLALIHAEASEGIEALRDAHLDPSKTYYKIDGTWVEASEVSKEERLTLKPEGLGSELADVVIRVGDLAGLAGIDLAAEIFYKMAFNTTRSYRHGGKRA